MKLDDAARELIGSGTDATLVTLNPDGSPQVTVVWVALRVDARRRRTRIRTPRRVPEDAQHPPRPARRGDDPACRAHLGLQTPYLAITGTARIVEGGAPELLKKLAKTMLGSDEHFPPPNSPPGLLTRIRIDKVGGHGPWAS